MSLTQCEGLCSSMLSLIFRGTRCLMTSGNKDDTDKRQSGATAFRGGIGVWGCLFLVACLLIQALHRTFPSKTSFSSLRDFRNEKTIFLSCSTKPGSDWTTFQDAMTKRLFPFWIYTTFWTWSKIFPFSSKYKYLSPSSLLSWRLISRMQYGLVRFLFDVL